MHDKQVRELVKQVRDRIEEGDKSSIPPLPVEQLEDLVSTLAYQLEKCLEDKKCL